MICIADPVTKLNMQPESFSSACVSLLSGLFTFIASERIRMLSKYDPIDIFKLLYQRILKLEPIAYDWWLIYET